MRELDFLDDDFFDEERFEERFEELFLADERFVPLFFDDERFDEDFFEDERFDEDFFDVRLRGTFAPDSRASLRPIAMACSRLFTLRPEPLFSVPFLRLCIARFTDFPAALPYFRPPELFFAAMRARSVCWWTTTSGDRRVRVRARRVARGRRQRSFHGERDRAKDAAHTRRGGGL